MGMPVQINSIPSPSGAIDEEYINKIIRVIDNNFKKLNNAGPIRATTINISDLPTSATGLKAGDLWNDAGTVKVV